MRPFPTPPTYTSRLLSLTVNEQDGFTAFNYISKIDPTKMVKTITWPLMLHIKDDRGKGSSRSSNISSGTQEKFEKGKAKGTSFLGNAYQENC